MKFEAVIFDLFGTLVDDFGSSVGQMHQEMAAALGVPYEQFIQLCGVRRRKCELSAPSKRWKLI